MVLVLIFEVMKYFTHNQIYVIEMFRIFVEILWTSFAFNFDQCLPKYRSHNYSILVYSQWWFVLYTADEVGVTNCKSDYPFKTLIKAIQLKCNR